MATPLTMLLLLLLPWWFARWRWPCEPARQARAARWGLAALFLFTASGHVFMDRLMAEMLPPWVPARLPLVWASGLLELAIAAGLVVDRTRRAAAWTAFAVLLLFYPANVYAAFQQVPLGGHAWGPVYLLLRTPVQLALLVWTWRFGLGGPRLWPSHRAPRGAQPAALRTA